MKLIYNPFYKGRPYRKITNKCIFNEKTVENTGLLNELELRAGLSCKAESTIIRAISYRKALKQYIVGLPNGQKAFFAESFEIDDLGVSTELLRWRDALILSGWNETIKGISDKVDAMAEIESIFKSDDIFKPGIADRWIMICDFSKNNTILDSSDTLEILSQQDALLPVIKQTIDNMQQKGLKVEYRQVIHNWNGEPTNNLERLQAFLNNGNDQSFAWEDNDDSLQLIHFKDLDAEYEWAASYTGEKGFDYDITICSDPHLLNNNLQLFGKPVVDSQIENTNPQILQLLYLGISLFYRPLSIHHLLSYLLVPVHPLPIGLRNRLVKALSHDNGLGEQWKAVFEGDNKYLFRKSDNSEEEDLKLKEKKMKLIAMVMSNDCLEEQSGTISIKKQSIKEYVEALRQWAYERCALAQNENQQICEQLTALSSICEALLFLLEEEAELIAQTKLFKWLSRIYSPITYTQETAKIGSMDITEDIHNITDAPASLLWLSSNEKNVMCDLYDFLSSTEKENLQQQGMLLQKYETLISAEREDVRRAIYTITDKMTLVYADKDCGNALIEPYMITIIRKAFGLDKIDGIQTESPAPNAQFNTLNVRTDLGKKELQDGFTSPIKRDPSRPLSYSQLEKLILRPFQYVIDYWANLKDTGSQELADLTTVQGTLAHKYIESLVKQGNGATPFTNTSEDDFETAINTLAQQYAAIMLLEENKINFTTYKKLLYESVKNLGDIISTNKLEIVGSEYNINENITDLGDFTGNIDLLLKTSTNEYIIFDLKWSTSKYYSDKISENTASQLRIYEELLKNERKNVIMTAYYLLPKKQLLTEKKYAQILQPTPHILIIASKDPSDLLDKLKNSFDFRLNQLDQGIVEDAEGMKIAGRPPMVILDYQTQQEAKNLYPLDTINNEKRPEFGNKNKILRGDLK